MNDRELALKMLFLSVKERLNFGFDIFVNCFNDWEIFPLTQNNKVIGAVILKDAEIHVGYGEKPKGSILKHIKQTLFDVIEKNGFAMTMVSENNPKGLKFCKRLGFVETEKKNGKIYMKCERCNYAN
jgi:hypothetical protein